jgi:hypothetical protein
MLIHQAFKNTLRHEEPRFISLVKDNPWLKRDPQDFRCIYDILEPRWVEQQVSTEETRVFTAKHEGQRLVLVLEMREGEMRVASLSYAQ